MKQEHKKAFEIIKEGGVIIYPTDTACGIGGRIDNIDTVNRIFSIKGRDTSKATPVLFSSIEMVKQYVIEIPQEVQDVLMKQYWPGALTIILQAKEERVAEIIRGGGKTIGVRIPDYKEITDIIEEIGVPLIGTSANFSGEPSIYDTNDVSAELAKQVDFIIPGVCSLKKASTVIDCSQKPWKILREGGVIITL